MKKVLVLPGGKWQIPLIQHIKKLGHYVICTDPNADAGGFLYADEYYIADALDKEKNLEIAKQCEVDAILTDQSDIAVPTAAYVSQCLGLPTIGTDKSHLFTSKYSMYTFAKKHGFTVPESALCTCVEQAIEFYQNHADEKKIVMKPDSSQSSRGVYFPSTEEEILEHFSESQNFSSDRKSVILQTYVGGTEFTVDGIYINGVHYSLAISKKTHFSYNESIAHTLLFGPYDDDFDYDLLRSNHNKLMNAAEVPFGVTHTEYKYYNGKYYLIEMAARGGGTRISSHIVKAISGVDNYRFLIEQALGEDVEFEPQDSYVSEKPWAILKFFDDSLFRDDRGHKVKAIAGLEDIRKMNGIIDSDIEVKPGDIVSQPKDDRSRVGYLIANAESLQQLETLVFKAENMLKVELE